MSWPPRWTTEKDAAKPIRTAGKVKQRKVRRDRKTKEDTNKLAAKKRDGYRCRFPLCGCRGLGLVLDARLEASHDVHKGMGGNPAGDRSQTGGLITLCLHRHQDSAISRHKGTLRNLYRTPLENDGPIEWAVHARTLLRLCPDLELPPRREWVIVATETAVQQLEPLARWQVEALQALAGAMDR